MIGSIRPHQPYNRLCFPQGNNAGSRFNWVIDPSTDEPLPPYADEVWEAAWRGIAAT